ncbi:hypothetical protein KO516_00260 [Citreicella sp. C3M06]|uniref:tripartite tricarboxylate transporter TctB family protein n=1 Tax=Roseobacteraceae TaxID=2854170 RepID=UPI001C091EFD|nr:MULTISPECIES: tripartite tricarboxylate transporter TctB family protein [Roseobacteraceae]MBU2959273.1 hypothetical protein [Citreicella sp. C3M06]MDO6585196.1 hypothetical protein [Salipiger sp. 1_MG-2023]
MTSPVSEDIKFEGEDANAGLAAPVLDLIAAGALLLTAVVVMIASLRLPVPGSALTAPGLLPFVAGASLAVMALILGNSALQRRKDGSAGELLLGDVTEHVRMLALAAMVGAYILGLQFLAFQVFFSIAGAPFVLSAFEPVSFIALTGIMHVFWRGPLWAKAAIALFWTIALSVVFQKLFHIPLPGGF